MAKKVVFYFPWKEISGGPFYLTQLANDLAKDTKFEVFYTDYKNGLCETMLTNSAVKQIIYSDTNFIMPFKDEPIILVVPVYWAHMLPKLHPNSTIVFFNWHYYSITVLKRDSGWSDEKLERFLNLVSKTNSCFFCDYSHLMGQNTSKIKFKELFVPNTIPPKKQRANTSLVSKNEINIAILGRLDGDKINSCLNLLDNLVALSLNKKVNVYIIGDGVHRTLFETECKNAKYHEHNINLIMKGTLLKDELNNYLASKVDILFAMGMSVLEGAAIGLPSVVIASNAQRFYTDAFVYLCNTYKYCLGWVNTQINELGIDTVPLKTILEAVYKKGLKKELSARCLDYYEKNHSTHSNAKQFKKALKQSSLKAKNINDLDNIPFLTKLKRSIFSIERYEKKKIITIFGFRIVFRNWYYITNQQTHILKQNIDSLKQNIDNMSEIKDNMSFDTCNWLLSRNDYEKFVNFSQKEYLELVKNLDTQSLFLVNRILTRLKSYWLYRIATFYLTQQEKDEIRNVYDSNLNNIQPLGDFTCYGKYILPISKKEISIFTLQYKCFTNELKTLDQIRKKGIIDIGASIGDSSLVLSELSDDFVYAFESKKDGFNKLKETIKLNNANKIKPFNCTIGNESINLRTTKPNLNFKNLPKYAGKKVSLDKIVEQNKLEIGLIKISANGLEIECLDAAKSVIKKQKPALLITIYNSAKNFFEIKTLLQSWQLGYEFKIRKPFDLSLITDTTLICEVQ